MPASDASHMPAYVGGNGMISPMAVGHSVRDVATPNKHILEVGEEPCVTLDLHHHAAPFTEELIPGLAGYLSPGTGLCEDSVEPLGMMCG